MLDDDAVIAESWQQPERFAVLFGRHAAYIHRYLARRTDSQAAEDLVAETFLTAFRKRRRYQHGYANARPWLYGIATHLVGQHYRDLARQHRLYQAAGPAPVSPDFSERADARVTATAIRPVLTEALASLPPGDRDVLLLVAWEERSYVAWLPAEAGQPPARGPTCYIKPLQPPPHSPNGPHPTTRKWHSCRYHDLDVAFMSLSASRQWFASTGIQPCEVTYEDLAQNRLAVANGVLGFLNLPRLDANSLPPVRYRQQADTLTDRYVELVRSATGGRCGPR